MLISRELPIKSPAVYPPWRRRWVISLCSTVMFLFIGYSSVELGADRGAVQKIESSLIFSRVYASEMPVSPERVELSSGAPSNGVPSQVPAVLPPPPEVELPIAPEALPSSMAEDISTTSVGESVGQFSVNEGGQATYTLPLTLPHGVAGVTPTLSLHYVSGMQNGPMGLGWSLAGLSQISRCGARREQDGDTGAVTLSDSDRYCLDGQHLILVSGGYGQAESEYRTELASVQRITAKGTSGHGPAYFTVESADGAVRYYGGEDIKGPRDDSVTKIEGSVVIWHQASFTDIMGKTGNSVYYRYTTGTGQDGKGLNETLLQSIDYSGHKVAFIYHDEPGRKDSREGYLYGVPFRAAARMSRIDVYAVKATAPQTVGLFRRYQFRYHIDSNTYIQMLESITESGAYAAASYPATRFTYTFPPGVSGLTNKRQVHVTRTHHMVTSRAMDINGDGWTDMLFAPSGNESSVKYFVNSKGQLGPEQSMSLVHSSYNINKAYIKKSYGGQDLNCDGVLDIILHLDTYSLECESNNAGPLLASSRLIGGVLTWESGQLAIHYTDTIPGSVKNYTADEDCEYNNTSSNYTLHSGDINGDGLTDTLWSTGSTWSLAINTGKGWVHRSMSALKDKQGIELHPSEVKGFGWSDINRDGVVDMLYFNTKDHCWQGDLTNPASFTPDTVRYLLAMPTASSQSMMWTADWDGDGIAGVASVNLTSGHLVYYPDGADRQAPSGHLLNRVTSGLGRQTHIEYGLLTDTDLYTPVIPDNRRFGRCQYENTLTPCSAVLGVVGPIPVVKTLRQASPGFRTNDSYQLTATLDTEYHYQQLLAQSGGRGMLGFARISLHDKAANTTA